jgi:hypothetical protein
MSTPVVYNGISYSVPSFGDTGYAQGSGNLSLYLVALATGSLQTTGGIFSLTADANFGLNFGLLSKYFTSISANAATAGVVRLANTDTIDWRNFANSGNNVLAVNTSDQLTYNGVPLTTAAAVTSVSGTANQINSTGGTTPVLSLSSTVVFPGTITLGGGTPLSTYVEGTWTPTDQSGAGLTLTIAVAKYTKIGKVVFIECFFVMPSTASGAGTQFGTLPFTVDDEAMACMSTNVSIDAIVRFIPGTTKFEVLTQAGRGAITNASLSTAQVIFTGFYFHA